MPFFGNFFSPKKIPLRKILSSAPDETHLNDLISNDKTVHLKLGNEELTFENGEWTSESSTNGLINQSNKNLRREIQKLQEENNLLKLQYTILLNMLTQFKAEVYSKEHQDRDKTKKSKN